MAKDTKLESKSHIPRNPKHLVFNVFHSESFKNTSSHKDVQETAMARLNVFRKFVSERKTTRNKKLGTKRYNQKKQIYLETKIKKKKKLFARPQIS